MIAIATRALLLTTVLVVACGEKKDPPPPAQPVLPGVAATQTGAVARGDGKAAACPHTGLWAQCSIERRLRQAGFVLRPVTDSAAARAGFSVAPVAYLLGDSRLEIFLYPDSAALAREMKSLDTLTVAPRGVVAAWSQAPTLIRSVNLAAVLLGKNQRQAERLAVAITAGPPQPGSPR